MVKHPAGIRTVMLLPCCLLVCGCGLLGIGRRDPRELASPLPDVRREALLTLSESGVDSAPIIVQYLVADEDALVRATAAVIIGDFNWREGVPQLVRAVQEDPSPIVRTDACEALGKIQDVQSGPALAVALRDPNEGVRRAAASALAKVGERATIPALVNALEDEDYGVRLAACAALAVMTGQNLPPRKTAWEEWLAANRGPNQ
ncbi:MAG: HEAT repeat domain-containing protein [Planctomycetota bacterium]|nr:HEAT repeat domain-containing protein [Planctomycetota bacterium]